MYPYFLFIVQTTHIIIFLLRFYEQRNICKQNWKETDSWCTTKQLGLYNIRLLTRRKSCFNIVCTRQMYVHVPWPISSLCFLSFMSIRSYSSYNPTMHSPQEVTPFLPLRGNSFHIFSLGLIPNNFNERKTSKGNYTSNKFYKNNEFQNFIKIMNSKIL